jgi:hypothetical protein
MNSPSAIARRLEQIKNQASVDQVIFRTMPSKSGGYIDVEAVTLGKHGKISQLAYIPRIFSRKELDTSNSDIEESFKLAGIFSRYFSHSALKKIRGKKFLFSHHDDTRGYNLVEGRWEKIIT